LNAMMCSSIAFDAAVSAAMDPAGNKVFIAQFSALWPSC
jgi:hypothetical protein